MGKDNQLFSAAGNAYEGVAALSWIFLAPLLLAALQIFAIVMGWEYMRAGDIEGWDGITDFILSDAYLTVCKYFLAFYFVLGFACGFSLLGVVWGGFFLALNYILASITVALSAESLFIPILWGLSIIPLFILCLILHSFIEYLHILGT